MKIYHYTNIDSLALILKNRTIRFNRLDQVDDLEEGLVNSQGVYLGKYIFASCWTENSEENIALWKMYGGDKGGIRISMDKEMFEEYLITNLNINGNHSEGAVLAKIPKEEFLNPHYFIFPIFDYNNEMFYRHITYVDDMFKYTNKTVSITNVQDNRSNVSIDMGEIGKYKNKRWAFQEETRFILTIFPFNPLLECQNQDIGTLAVQSLIRNTPLPFTYYDLHLKESAINNMEITMSPSCTESERIIIKALLEKYAPYAQIKESTLGKIVRLK